MACSALLFLLAAAACSAVRAPFDRGSIDPRAYSAALRRMPYARGRVPDEGGLPVIDAARIMAQLEKASARMQGATLGGSTVGASEGGAELRFATSAEDAADGAEPAVVATAPTLGSAPGAAAATAPSLGGAVAAAAPVRGGSPGGALPAPQPAQSATSAAAAAQGVALKEAGSAAGAKVGAAWSTQQAAAGAKVGSAYDESAQRVGVASADIKQSLAKDAAVVGGKLKAGAQAVGQAVKDGAQYLWDHREEYAEDVKRAARAAVHAGKEFAKFADENKASISAIKKGLADRFKAAGGEPQPSMTDLELCTGCQMALSMVLEHTDLGSDAEGTLFALHSACHDQPPLLDETCEALMDRDTVVVSQLLVSRDAPFVCSTLGMCYAELLGGGDGLPKEEGDDGTVAAPSPAAKGKGGLSGGLPGGLGGLLGGKS